MRLSPSFYLISNDRTIDLFLFFPVACCPIIFPLIWTFCLSLTPLRLGGLLVNKFLRLTFKVQDQVGNYYSLL